MIKKFGYLFVVALFVSAVLVVSAQQCDAMVIFGDGDWGNFTGTLDYSYADEYNSLLTISLKNTSPDIYGGYITGFSFNNPSNLIDSVTHSATNSNFALLGGPSYDNNNIGEQPYGNFDIGVSIFGNPSSGIAVNNTDTFYFTFTGTGLNILNENSFMSELSSGAGAGEGYESFVVRFMGFTDKDESSDKVPGRFDTPPGGGVVPEPFTMSLMGIGLLGFGILKRKHKRN